MTTATYTQPTHDRPSRWILPVVGVAFGIAGVAMSVVAITTDDVAHVLERTVVVEAPAAVDSATAASEAPVDVTDTCGFRRLTVNRC